jgi:excinuclease ABC subunit C
MILISDDFEDRNVARRSPFGEGGRKVTISEPQRGEKRELVDHAKLSNAREALGRRWPKPPSQARLLEGRGGTFGLDPPPRRIEVYDNSHIMGTNAVGGMIVAGPEGFRQKPVPQVQHPLDRHHAGR